MGMNDAKRGGVNWRELMKIVAPVVGDLATQSDDGSFMSGFQRAQQRGEETKRQKEQESYKRKVAGAQFRLSADEALRQLTDPIEHANAVAMYDDAGAQIGYNQPGELTGHLKFNQSRFDRAKAEAQLKEVNQQLDDLMKGPTPFDLDQLAEGESTIQMKDGQRIPIARAMEMTQRRPLDASGAAIPQPKKVEKPADLPSLQHGEVFHNGKMVPANFNPKTGKWTDDTGAVLTGIGVKPDKPVDPTIQALRDVALAKAQGGGGAPKRRMLASDANRIAELDTSLNDVDVLERDLGKTGAASKVGAMLPNVVTEMTGLGSGAKQRQAVIDRVKQVIGKALEGGVLRKEDEYKYEKILPTIGDPPEVAATKIAGLRAALRLRRQTTLEALSDADFDTSKFEARSATPSLAAGKRDDPLGLR